MVAEVHKVGNYVISTSEGVATAGTYVVDQLEIPKSAAYVVDRTAISKAQAYMVTAPKYPPYGFAGLGRDFIEARFPDCISYGSEGGPMFKNSEFSFDSGYSVFQDEWRDLRSSYNIVLDYMPSEYMFTIMELFYAARGKARAFRFKDWGDYQVANQPFAVGDGNTQWYKLFKRYPSGGKIYDRMLHKIVPETAIISLQGTTLVPDVDYHVQENTGNVYFQTALPYGHVAKIEYVEFDVPVRFDTDELSVSIKDFRQETTNIELIEVLVENGI